MFTGIIEETGTVERVVDEPDGRRIRVATDFEDLSHGDSVSVGGVCLTVEEHGDGWFTAFTATETLDATTLSDVADGDAVNLERALPAEGRLDGHIVQGHVDTTTEVVGVEAVGEDWTYTFVLPEGHEQYVAQKGSITLDGVSLTVADVDDRAGTFSVAVVPTTYDLTTLSERAPGDRVNVEVDVVAKYVERLDAY
ncbi:riboflavin synthase [Halobacterium hubeiense]|uniref:riboflavin synthase n=1 Tax=Halobacterium hubeiense TaxID=1407499 RepID=UPI003C77A103